MFCFLCFYSLSDKRCVDVHYFICGCSFGIWAFPRDAVSPPALFVCSAVGQLSSVCSLRPAAGGALNGLPHCESLGGCPVGGVEHRGLHLWLHPHQRHGAADPRPGERHHSSSVCHRAAVSRGVGTLHLHLCEETLTRLERQGRRFIHSVTEVHLKTPRLRWIYF